MKRNLIPVTFPSMEDALHNAYDQRALNYVEQHGDHWIAVYADDRLMPVDGNGKLLPRSRFAQPYRSPPFATLMTRPQYGLGSYCLSIKERHYEFLTEACNLTPNHFLGWFNSRAWSYLSEKEKKRIIRDDEITKKCQRFFKKIKAEE